MDVSTRAIPALVASVLHVKGQIYRGKTAYAHRQASIRDAMQANFRIEWVQLESRLTSMDDRDPTVMIECDGQDDGEGNNVMDTTTLNS